MEMQIDYKDVTIKERHFRIKKFTARTGSYMLFKLTGLLAPLIKGVNLNDIKITDDVKPEDIDLTKFNITGVIEEMSKLPEQEFDYIQDKCLEVCSELLPSGPANVLNADGSFGVIGLENDTMSVLALTAHALIFNLTGFFGESLLSSLTDKLKNISQQNAAM